MFNRAEFRKAEAATLNFDCASVFSFKAKLRIRLTEKDRLPSTNREYIQLHDKDMSITQSRDYAPMTILLFPWHGRTSMNLRAIINNLHAETWTPNFIRKSEASEHHHNDYFLSILSVLLPMSSFLSPLHSKLLLLVHS